MNPEYLPQDSEDRKRQERRRYIAARAQRTAVRSGSGKKAPAARRPWGIDEARIALNLTMTVPEAAMKINRTASAVEELRKRWRAGRLPASLAEQIAPPAPPAARQD